MSLEITQENITKILSENELTILQFSAPWCAPCRALQPIMDELSLVEGSSYTIGKVDVDESTDLALEYGIRGVPSILFIKNGDVVDRFVGLRTKNELQEKINSLLN